MNDLQTTNNGELAHWEKPEVLTARIGRMLEIQSSVMKSDIDYGVIPGCKKPTLYKPGAEMLMVTFQLNDKPYIEDLSDYEAGYVKYRITSNMHSNQTGAYLGYGIGECSSLEEKYHWKKAVCQEEFDSLPEDKRRLKWIKPYNKDAYSVIQVQVNPADIANTILKMAKKRSKVDGVMSVLGASRIYTQDIEDFDEEMRGVVSGAKKSTSSKPKISRPTVVKKSGGEITDEMRKENKWISSKQVGLIHGKCKDSGMDVEQLKAYLVAKKNIVKLDHISWVNDEFKKLLTFIADKKMVKKVNEFQAVVEDAPLAFGAEEFKAALLGTGIIGGMTEQDINNVLSAELSIKNIDSITTEQQDAAIDLITREAESRAKVK